MYNFYTDDRAGKASNEVVQEWPNLDIVDKNSISSNEDNNVSELVKVKDGIGYYGIVEIPVLNLRLPVNEEWSSVGSQQSPCRYAGSAEDKNLIIAAHNYSNHFGNIGSLSSGDVVYFTDAMGYKYYYEVDKVEVLDGTDVEGMQDKKYDLTLFTCTYSGAQRVTVRCLSVNVSKKDRGM